MPLAVLVLQGQPGHGAGRLNPRDPNQSLTCSLIALQNRDPPSSCPAFKEGELPLCSSSKKHPEVLTYRLLL